MLTRKDIIAINQSFHTGKIVNLSSLDFALDQARKTRDWLKGCSFIVRAILLDHVFEDGNKRTATATIMTYVDLQDLRYDKEQISRVVINITKKQINNIEKIMRLIKNGIQ